MLRDFFLQSYAAIPASVTRGHIERVVRAYLDSYANADIAGRVTLFAEDVVAEEPVGHPPIVGRDALVAFWEGARDAGWEVRNQLSKLVVNGHEAIIVFRSVLSVPDQGSVAVDIYETLEFNDQGLISKLRAYNDEGCLHDTEAETAAEAEAEK